MKWLMLVVASLDVALFDTAKCFILYNKTQGSFDVTTYIPDHLAIITDNEEPGTEIANTRVPSGAEIRYWVGFPGSFLPQKGDEPFLNFKSKECEFKVLYNMNGYPFLRCDTATEFHNYGVTDCYHYDYVGDAKAHYFGSIFDLLIVGDYRVALFYERHGRGRGVVIEYVTDDDSWMKRINEDDLLRYSAGEMQPQPKHWWSKLCSCTG
ncbi:MAG: hypothetical protein LBQ43_00740 [Holosporales bacterium]|jgi:hypothetical protein|nr:hypothetical protein [Holosporales bacterium]